MLKYLSVIFFGFCFLMVWGCGGDEPDVHVTMKASKTQPSSYTVVRVNADLLKQPPKSDLQTPISLMMVDQGDQIMIIETKGDWAKVQHVLSGRIGWLNKSFIQQEVRSKWWSGDTDKARNIAERIYKDKIFLERNWPVIHINIEERWNKLVFTIKENRDFQKKEAIHSAEFAMDWLVKSFPHWSDHQVFMESQENGESYTLVMSDDRKPTFL